MSTTFPLNYQSSHPCMICMMHLKVQIGVQDHIERGMWEGRVEGEGEEEEEEEDEEEM